MSYKKTHDLNSDIYSVTWKYDGNLNINVADDPSDT